MIVLEKDGLQMLLQEPGEGLYLGTRFDRSGVFAALEREGVNYTERWNPSRDPFLHDNVCGPVDEFSAIGFEAAAPGEPFLKIGVGLLRRPDASPYDRFRLYEMADPGRWEVFSDGTTATFRHTLEGWCRYTKEIAVLSRNHFCIRHLLDAGRPLSGDTYNHHFFTLGKLSTGPGRLVGTDFAAAGEWRAPYESVVLERGGFRFRRSLEPGETVYMGGIHALSRLDTPYRFSLQEMENGCGVHISGNLPVDRAVFWANHRIACIEPYVLFSLREGERFAYTLDYWLK